MRALLCLATARALADLRMASDLAGPEAEVHFCVLPSTTNVPDGASCKDMNVPSRSNAVGKNGDLVELDLMVGEAEHFLVLIEGGKEGAGKLALNFPQVPLHTHDVTPMAYQEGGEPTRAPDVSFSWRQLGYVKCKKTARYEVGNQASAWRSDPLLNDDQAEVGADQNTVLWVTAKAPVWSAKDVRAAAAASKEDWISDKNDTVEVKFGAADKFVSLNVPVRVKVWPVILPDNVNAKVTQYWNFLGIEKSFSAAQQALYTNLAKDSQDRVEQSYFDLLAENRIPATDFERMDEASWRESATHTPYVSLWFKPHQPACGTEAGDALDTAVKDGLDKFAVKVELASAFVAKFNAENPKLKPRKLATYMYDEAEESCLPVLKTVLEEMKTRWPDMVTISPLNWKVPIDLPLDVHCMEYDKYVGDNREHGMQRAQEGKEMWLYHCVEPAKQEYMNTFIESPLTGSRLLFWLAAAQPEITGWLYWSEASWMSCPEYGEKLKSPVQRVGASPNGHIDFEPAQYWECDNPDYRDTVFTNGDGYVVYPGPKGPVESARMHTIRDGIEDLELFRMLHDKTGAVKLATQLVQPATEEGKPPLWGAPFGPTDIQIKEVRLEALKQAAAQFNRPAQKAAAAVAAHKAPAADLRSVAVNSAGAFDMGDVVG